MTALRQTLLLLASALDIVMDFLSAGFIILQLSLEMVHQGAALDMLDREVLAQ